MASHAFRPFHGAVAACAARPWNFARIFQEAFVRHDGILKLDIPCVITQASTLFQAPWFAMIHFPPPDSSAGVPIRITVPLTVGFHYDFDGDGGCYG
jgi:hypothetical protein